MKNIYIVTTKEEQSILAPQSTVDSINSLDVGNAEIVYVDDNYPDKLKDGIIIIETKYPHHIQNIRSLIGKSAGENKRTVELDADKTKLHKLMNSVGIRCPKQYTVQEVEEGNIYFVKPLYLEDSIGIDKYSICYNVAEVVHKVAEIAQKYAVSAIIEDYIDGFDATVGIIKIDGEFEIAVARQIPDSGDILTYKNKSKVTRHERLPIELEKKLELIGLAIFSYIQGKHYGRIDFRVRDGKVYVLEVNMYAGLGKDGFMRKTFTAHLGWNYRQLIGAVLRSVQITN